MICPECGEYIETRCVGERMLLLCRDGLGGVLERDAVSALPCRRFCEVGSAQRSLFGEGR